MLDISGAENLGGTLDVDLFDLGNGFFEPSLGDTFDILAAETLNGEFDLLIPSALGGGLGWQVDYLIDFGGGTTDFVQLSVVSAVPIPASVWLFGSGLLGLAGMVRRKAI